MAGPMVREDMDGEDPDELIPGQGIIPDIEKRRLAYREACREIEELEKQYLGDGQKSSADPLSS